MFVLQLRSVNRFFSTSKHKYVLLPSKSFPTKEFGSCKRTYNTLSILHYRRDEEKEAQKSYMAPLRSTAKSMAEQGHHPDSGHKGQNELFPFTY